MVAQAGEIQAPGSGGGTDALLRPVIDVFESFGQLVLLTGRTLAWVVRPPYRPSQLLSAMDFIGVQSVFIVSLTGIFSGMVLALQTVNSLRQFGAEGVVGSIVAISLTREISPVFAALMVTARAGSAMAAELGNMRVTEQIDALVTMGVSPVQYLLSPRMVASVLMVPLLCVLYTCVGMVGAWLIAVELLSVDPGIFLSNIERYLELKDFWMGEIKGAVFGFLIAVISCRRGFFAEGGARGVGTATTRAVVESAVAILIANYFITDWLTEV
jgi:phospholipid/cholesterol/gamma-HCH transport system permease protein